MERTKHWSGRRTATQLTLDMILPAVVRRNTPLTSYSSDRIVCRSCKWDPPSIRFRLIDATKRCTVIPLLTKIIRSGITFVSRNVILYKLYKSIIHFILLNWKYVHNVFTILLPNFQSLFKVSSWNGPTVHVCCFMLERASTKTFVSRIHIR